MIEVTPNDLRPIGLDAVMQDAALTDRVDVKYIVDATELGELLRRLASSHAVLEIDGRREFRYRTVYYDTPDLLMLREHRANRRRRFKVRTRTYVDAGRSTLEVKLKGSRGRTVKHAVPYAGGIELDAEALDYARDVVRTAYARELPTPLRPTVTVDCRRVTLVSPSAGERTTCDIALDLGGSRLLPGHAIVESKSAGGRALADRILRDMGVRPAARCSKYCLGVTLAPGEPRVNDVLALARSYFGREGGLPDAT